MQYDITEAKEHLLKGNSILYPTDTIWGLGCDATNEEACLKIIDLKNRPDEKSFIVLMDSFQMVEKYIPEFPEVVYELVDYSEKPLTIIYPNAKGLAKSVLASDGSVGIRITKDPLCLALIRSIKKPIVATSANISNEKIPTCFQEIDPRITDKADYIVKEKLTEKSSLVSQIIKIGLDSSVKVIRK